MKGRKWPESRQQKWRNDVKAKIVMKMTAIIQKIWRKQNNESSVNK